MTSRRLGWHVLVGVGYLATALVGVQVATIATHITPVWPPFAIAMAGMFLGGPSFALPVLAAILLVQLYLGDLSAATPFIVIGGLSSTALGAWLLRRACVRPQLDRVRDVLALGLYGAILAPIPAATIGSVSLYLVGRFPIGSLPDAWWTWWVGDAMGVLVVTPLICVFSVGDDQAWTRARVVESIVSAAGSLATVSWVFLTPPGNGMAGSRAFLTYPWLVWAALRLGHRVAISRLAVVSAVAVIGTASLTGAFAGETQADGLRDLEAFLVVSAVSTLLIGATVAEARREAEERTQAEADLAASRELFDRFMAEGPMAAFVKDEAGRYVYVNAQWERRLGVSGRPWRGRTDHELYAVELANVRRAHDVEVREAGEARVHEEIVPRAAGEETWLFARFLVSGRDGQRLLGGMALDVTDQKAAELRQRELEAQLAQGQRMEALGVLAGGVAHDFNNLLAVVVTNGELVRREANGPSQLAAREILRAAERARDLVRSILVFSRRTEVRRVSVCMSEVARESAAFLRASLPSTITLELEVAADLPSVRGDPSELGRVVVNLVTNAAQAQAGRGVVRVEVLREGEGTATELLLRVVDQGHGMDASTQARIFQPFFTTKTPGTGTGLGLAVVQEVVREHGGIIEVESEPGRGTTVTVRLPAQLEDDFETGSTDSLPGPRTSLRVLLVDDEAMLLAAVARALRLRGYEVALFDDPRAALEAFAATPTGFDVLVTDLTMPGLTGLELAELVGRVIPDFPVVVATGFPGDVDPRDLRAVGVRTLLTKPFSVGELERVMAAAVHPDGA